MSFDDHAFLAQSAGIPEEKVAAWKEQKFDPTRLRIGSYIQLKKGKAVPSKNHTRSSRSSAATSSFVYYPNDHFLVLDVDHDRRRVLLYGVMANWFPEELAVWEYEEMHLSNASSWYLDLSSFVSRSKKVENPLSQWKNVLDFGHDVVYVEQVVWGYGHISHLDSHGWIAKCLEESIPVDTRYESLCTYADRNPVSRCISKVYESVAQCMYDG